MVHANDAVVGFIVPEPKPARASIRAAALLALGLVALDLVLAESSSRLVALRAVLVLMAAGEIAGALGQGFFTLSLAERKGIRPHPESIVTVQDFALYDAAMAALLVAALGVCLFHP